MREIKFRGRFVRKANALYPAEDKWVYGFFYIEKSNPFGRYWIKDGNKSYAVIKESVGQYAGRKDKNGKEIYEGDILRYKFIEIVKNMEVSFYDGTFMASCYGWDIKADLFIWAKIIGNTCENPELLEEK